MIQTKDRSTSSKMLLTFTFPHFKILISSGPKFFTSLIFNLIFDDFAVILSNPINIACEELIELFFFFLAFNFWFLFHDHSVHEYLCVSAQTFFIEKCKSMYFEHK